MREFSEFSGCDTCRRRGHGKNNDYPGIFEIRKRTTYSNKWQKDIFANNNRHEQNWQVGRHSETLFGGFVQKKNIHGQKQIRFGLVGAWLNICGNRLLAERKYYKGNINFSNNFIKNKPKIKEQRFQFFLTILETSEKDLTLFSLNSMLFKFNVDDF